MEVTNMFTRWIEISLDDIKHNVKQIKASLSNETRLMAVVKGDAYGCGSVQCAFAALEAGCEMLGVTTLEEALELRVHGIDSPILVFSPLLSHEAKFYVDYNLIPTIISEESLQAFSQAALGNINTFHLKIETGMGRLGLKPEEVANLLQTLKELKNIKLGGIYTHFAKAADEGYVVKQVHKLLQAKEICHNNGFDNFIIHACASAAFLKYPQYHFDMVRVGTLLYGQQPAGVSHNLDLKDPWSCKARILQIKTIEPGESIGYGRDFIASKQMKIAIIPIGLADGFSLDPPVKAKSFLDLLKIIAKEILKFVGKPHNVSGMITYKGRSLPVIGRIGMQLVAVDISGFTDTEMNEVTVGIRRTSASAKIARVYKEHEKITKIRSIAGEEIMLSAYRGERM